jgi:hypothetical protein
MAVVQCNSSRVVRLGGDVQLRLCGDSREAETSRESARSGKQPVTKRRNLSHVLWLRMDSNNSSEQHKYLIAHACDLRRERALCPVSASAAGHQ